MVRRAVALLLLYASLAPAFAAVLLLVCAAGSSGSRSSGGSASGSREAKFFVPGAAELVGRAATAPSAWIPRRSDPRIPATMTLADTDTATGGSFGRPGQGLASSAKEDPYNTELTRQKQKRDQEMFDNLLSLKEKLETELPFMFIEDLDSSHFTSDVVFKEPHLPPIRGRQNYQLFLRGLRDTGNLLFEEPRFEVVRATQHAEDGLVKVRWKISGHYQSPFKFFQTAVGCFDGISYYYVAGSSGLVSVHQVDYQTPILPPVLNRQDALLWFDKALAGVPSVPACSTFSEKEPDSQS